MGFFKRRRLRKFGEQAEEQDVTFFVFGANIFTERFCKELMNLGLRERMALISTEKSIWTEELEEKELMVMYEKRTEEYDKKFLYESIGLEHAENIIVLHDDAEIIDNIVSHSISVASEAKIIVLGRFAPPFINYLASAYPGKIKVVDDVSRVVRDLYAEFDVSLKKPLIIQIPAQKNLIGRNPFDFKVEDCTFLKIIRTVKNKAGRPIEKLFSLNDILKEDDQLMVYLKSIDALRNLVEFCEGKETTEE